MTTPDSASDLIASSSQHVSPEPVCRPPASRWSLWSSWLAGGFDSLVLVARQLVWLSQPAGGGSVLWTLLLSDLGRTPPRALVSFSPDLDDRCPCLTTYTMHRLMANAEWIYFDHPEGFARIPLTGGDPEVIARIAPNDPRRVTSLAWIDGALWLAGWLDTDDASDPYDPYDPDDPNGAHDARRSRAFVARVEYGTASTRWEVPTRRWPCVQLVADQHGAWLLADDRLFRVTADGGVPLASDNRIYQLHALPSGLYATVVPGGLVRLDSQTGQVDAAIVFGMPEEIHSVCQAGDWVCVSAGRELIAVRPDGGDLRSVLVTHGQIADLCSEGQFVYWRSNSANAVCRVSLGTDGAPLPMPVSVVTEEPAEGTAGYEVSQAAFSDGRRPEDFTDVHHRPPEPATARASSQLRVADDNPRADESELAPPAGAANGRRWFDPASRAESRLCRRAPSTLIDLAGARRDWDPEPPLVQLGSRCAQSQSSQAEYEALLEAYRCWVLATAVVAIAKAWDSGRLSPAHAGALPHESEVMGLTGTRAGRARSQLDEAMRGLHRATEELDAVRYRLAREPSPFDVLCADHGIGQIGALVLLFVVAPELWGDVARAFAICANDPARALCDRHLLLELLADLATRHDLACELGLEGPLVRQGILRVDRARGPFAGLTADPLIIERLTGARIDHGIEPGLTRVAATVRLEDFLGHDGAIQGALAELRVARDSPGRLVVRGGRGEGRRTLLATLAHKARRTLSMIDGAALIREDRVRTLAELLQRAHLRGWLPCVDGLELVAVDDHPKRDAVREVLRDHPGPLAMRLTGMVEPPLDPGYVTLDLWRAPRDERAEQWRQIAGASRLTVSDPLALADQFRVGPGTMRTVVKAVAYDLGVRMPELSVDRLLQLGMRQHLESKLGSAATLVTRLPPWSQVVLPAAIADRVAELMGRMRHRRTVYDSWGFDSVLATSRGIAALFQGGPGTGKTLLAGAIAAELGLDLYRVDLARVLSKWIGETEQNLARVFDAAEQGQAMILFDEADALFGQRTEVRTATDRYANLEINYLLQRLDTFEGVAVLTTNLGTAIDPAFHRRLTCHLTLPFPDAADRERLWRVHLPPQLPTAGPIDLGDLARRYEMSGGYIRNAALRAAFLAAQEKTPLTQFHLERAIRAEINDGSSRARSGPLA